LTHVVLLDGASFTDGARYQYSDEFQKEKGVAAARALPLMAVRNPLTAVRRQ
jgi:hypothetical protein